MSDTVKRKCIRCRHEEVPATLTITTRYRLGDEYIETVFNMCGLHIENMVREAAHHTATKADYSLTVGGVTGASPDGTSTRFLDAITGAVLDTVETHDFVGGRHS